MVDNDRGGACSGGDSPAAPGASETTALLSIVPTGGATDVDPPATVVVGFDHPMMPGMEAYALLHRGDVTGPEVPGAWRLSDDLRTLTFTPASLLQPGTTYTIHLGGGMMDADGRHVDFDAHGDRMGGVWASPAMMGRGMMGSGMMGGAVGDRHMGPGWQHPTNGSYGMVFTFTTRG
ncbi:MAG: Ig-like domain-containing protein [Gemmatimonadota bacterium]|jgi:hypothetical protein